MRSTSRLRELVLLALLVPLAACGSPVSVGGGGNASCAAVIEYDGHTYWGRGDLKRDPATTGREVTAVIPACDDTGGQDPAVGDESVRVSELVDVPLATGFLWQDAVYVREGSRLPPTTDAWFRAQRCDTAGAFELVADWLGVTSPHEPRFDGDLRPPYRLEVRVTDGPKEYVGTSIVLRADGATDPGLGPRDVKQSLWKGGQVAARVTCDEGRFRALSLRVPAGS